MLSTSDPARDGGNWYGYCNNSPIHFIDTNGLKPGDAFNSIEDAAIDFANTYNDDSIYNSREYGTVIYSFENDVGEKKYSYNVPNVGTSDSVNIDITVESNQTIESAIHSHGRAGADTWGISTEFPSSTDRNNMLTENNEYIVTPSGSIIEYGKNQNNDKIIYDKAPSDNGCVWHNDNNKWEYHKDQHK